MRLLDAGDYDKEESPSFCFRLPDITVVVMNFLTEDLSKHVMFEFNYHGLDVSAPLEHKLEIGERNYSHIKLPSNPVSTAASRNF